MYLRKIVPMTRKMRVAFCAACFAITAQAQVLDPSFSGDGKTTIGLANNGFNTLTKVKFLPDGKILACGQLRNGNVDHLTVIRFLADGSVDASFGDSGSYIHGIGNDTQVYNAQALQLLEDGKFVVAGTFTSDISNEDSVDVMVMKFNGDGSLDADFGTNGIVTTNMTAIEKGERISSIALQPDGKIVVAGRAYTNGINPDLTGYFEDFAVIRYNPDGSLDADFSTDGKLHFNIGQNIGGFNAASIDIVEDMKIQPDGKILLCGYSDAGSPVESYHLCMARLNPDGSFDTDFGSNGIVLQNLGGEEVYRSVELLGDGKILVSGTYQPGGIGPNTNMVFSRFNIDGTPDTSFAENGVSVIPFDNATNFGVLLDSFIDADGRVVAAGYKVNAAFVSDFVVAVVKPDGTLDANFNANGVMPIDFFNLSDYANSIDHNADGDFIVAGTAGIVNNVRWDFALAKFIMEDLSAPQLNASAVSVYPNPFTAELSVRGIDATNGLSVSLLELSGRKIAVLAILRSSATDVTFSVPAGLSKGLYLLQVSDGKNTAVQKVVKR